MDFVAIARFNSRLEAESVGHALDQYDIPFLVQSADVGMFGPGMIGTSPAGAQLMVPHDRVDEVRRLLTCVVELPEGTLGDLAGEELMEAVPPNRARLHQMLAERSYQRRKVTLASGRESNFYFDSKLTVLDAEGAELTAREFFHAISRLPEFDELEAVGGLELGSVPIGSALGVISYQSGHPLTHLVIRKVPKEHGTQVAIEGAALVEPGSVVAVIEDVVTTGGSSLQAARRLKEAGYDVRTLVTLIDREEGGRELIEAEGLQLVCLFTKSDFA
jgi:orotate phosphoribosyltransferase